MHILYIDTLFCTNWMMDSVILILTGHLLRRQIRTGRISIAAAAGSLWSCGYAVVSWKLDVWRVSNLAVGRTVLCHVLYIILWLTNWVVIPSMMVRLAYPERELRENLRGILCLYLSTALTGGLNHMLLEQTTFGRFWTLWMSETENGVISLWLLALAMLGSFLAVEMGMHYRSASSRREQIQEVTLYYEGTACNVKALWDSGNQLHDPYTGKCVHILDNTMAQSLLGEDMYHSVMKFYTGTGVCEAVRLVPCRSVGNVHILLPVLTVDRMRLADGSVLEHPIIGFSKEVLSSDGSYHMLLHGKTEQERGMNVRKNLRRSFVENDIHEQTK